MRCGLRLGIGKASVLALTALVIFVITVRPVSRPTSPLYGRLGLTRMSLLSVPADYGDNPAVLPPAAFFASVAPLALALAVVLKTHQSAIFSFRRHRLKLRPSRPHDDSPDSD